MIRVRKGIVYLLSLLLLATLLGTAFSTSVKHTLNRPEKVEKMLAQSKLYDHFVDYTADQAKKSEGDTDKSGSVSLGDAAVQAAARSAFPPELIQQSINTFIDSNYAWLQGKTAVPEFKIDLTAQKETFAQKVGRYVRNYTASLPVCTPAQTAAQMDVDPLAAICRPAKLSPDEAGSQAAERLSTTGDFLSDPVITADSVNPKGNRQDKPYYKKLSKLPHAYRVGTRLPYIFGTLSVLLAIGVVFLALTRRRGLRRLGIVLLIAGVLLIISKLIADSVMDHIESHIFSDTSVGPLQKSLTDFAHRVGSSIARVDMWFGIAFVILALAILAVLFKTRVKEPKKVSGGVAAGNNEGQAAGVTEESGGNGNQRLPRLMPRRRFRRAANDGILSRGDRSNESSEAGTSEPAVPEVKAKSQESRAAPKPKRRKPPRLIQ
jgi:hypothetical protein